MDHHGGLHRPLLDYGAVLGQVAKQNGDTAVLTERIVQVTDNLSIRLTGGVNPLTHRSVDCEQVTVNQPAFVQLLQHGLDTAHLIEVSDKDLASRVQLADLGGLPPDVVDLPQIDGASGGMGNGRDVQNRVGRTADGHIGPQGVFKRLGSQDIQRPDVFL